MDKFKLEKIIRENVIGIVLVLVIILLSIQQNLPFLNMIGSLLIIFIPVPFIIIGIRNGVIYSLLGMVVLGGILIYLYGPVVSLIISILFIPITLVIQILIKNKRKISEIFIISSIVFFASILVLAFITVQFGDINLSDEVNRIFKENKNQLFGMIEEQNVEGIDLEEIGNMLDVFYRNMIAVMPTIVLIMSSIIAYLNYKISTFILYNMGYRKMVVPDFSRFILPRDIVVGIIMSFIFLFFLKRQNVSYYSGVALNINGLISFIFLVQGVAIISFLLKRLRMGKVFRIILISFLMNIGFVGNVLFFLGMLDVFFDFRKIRN